MKILHIISQSPDFTGSGKFIREIIRQSTVNGHENFLVAGAQAGFKIPTSLIPRAHCSFIRFDGVDLDYAIPGMSDVMPYKSTVFSTLKGQRLSAYKRVFATKICKAIKRFQPDIIHTHHLWLVSAITRKAAPKLPMVTTCHGTCLRQHHLAPHIGVSIKENLVKIDRVIALSRDQNQQVVETLDVAADKISMISGGYNERLFYPAAKTFNGRVEMLYAGKLSPMKGVPWLLKSLGKIKGTPYRLHLAGNAADKQKKQCLALAGTLGNRVVYHGTLSHRDLSDLMRKVHIFILPSFYEGLPLVLTEAIACGCRIIATALAGVHEIFKISHPDMVTLIDLPKLETIDAPYQKDEKMLEERLSNVISQVAASVIRDPAPDMDYVDKIVSEYTWEKIFNRIETVYRELKRSSIE